MIYAVSDIHGCYNKYQELLKKIHFGSDDTLYVLGDVIDRGPDGFKILLDMAQRPTAPEVLSTAPLLWQSTVSHSLLCGYHILPGGRVSLASDALAAAYP